MSQTFSELTQMATAVRDHYNELQKVDDKKVWDASDRMAGLVVSTSESKKKKLTKAVFKGK